ncbi:MAG: cold-shock protein [Candidatus Omnitrophica bacterium]|nr:cold-shock protein [Candidatus Omnitrophota bacterium]
MLEYYVIRGFGYLKDEEKDEYCFYSKDVQLSGELLYKGDAVQFDLYKGRGTRAVNVRRNEH